MFRLKTLTLSKYKPIFKTNINNFQIQTRSFSGFRTAGEILKAHETPIMRKSKPGGFKQARLVDIHQGHNVAEIDGSLLEGISTIQTDVVERPRRTSNINSLKAKYIQTSVADTKARELMMQMRMKDRAEAQYQIRRMNTLAARYNRGKTSRGFDGIAFGMIDQNDVTGIKYKDWEIRIIQLDRISHMDRQEGRVYNMRVLIAMGNKNGGFSTGMANGENLGIAMKKAIQDATGRMERFDFYQNRTIFHDVKVTHMGHFLSIFRQPKGYGFRGNDLHRWLCDLVGLKDVYIKTGHQSRPRSRLIPLQLFKMAMRSLETPQQIAARTGLNVCELDELDNYLPRIVAVPDKRSENMGKVREFNQYDNYFKSTDGKTPEMSLMVRQLQRAAKHQRNYTEVNHSQHGFGWRKKINSDERFPTLHEITYLRRNNMRFLKHPEAHIAYYHHARKTNHMKGDETTSGFPFYPNDEQDIPLEIQNVGDLVIDENSVSDEAMKAAAEMYGLSKKKDDDWQLDIKI